MRYIKQRFLSKCLNRRRNNPPETTLAAKRAWRRTNKKDIRKACYKQQKGLCAYTELSLDDTELGYHLEHIAPRSSHPELTFVPHNIVLSIMDDIHSGSLQHHEKFGGHHKSEDYANDWFISPFDRDCATYFSYDLAGTVAASLELDVSNQMKATKTIEVLNLNAMFLVERRRESLAALKGQIESGALELVSSTMQPGNRNLTEFYSAKKQLLESLGISLPLPL